jgi:hypothetical protein
MQDIPGINLLPEQYRGTATLLIIIAPYLTRAYHAVVNGGGLAGIYRAILFGTNTPK